MNKKEAKQHLKEKGDKGYHTHTMLLELFEDEEEISKDWLNLMCYIPSPPKPLVYITSIEGAKLFDEALKREANKNIIKGG